MATLLSPPVDKQNILNGSKEWSYEEYLALPDDGQHYESIEGVLYVTNTPDLDHQFTVMEVAYQLKQFVNTKQLGFVLVAPFEVHLSHRTRPVQPDVIVIRTEKWPGSGAKYFMGAPDLVVEVLSTSTKRIDRLIKFAAYEQAEVAEYWIVDPKTKWVEVYSLSVEEYALVSEVTGDDLIQSPMLPEMKVVSRSLFS